MNDPLFDLLARNQGNVLTPELIWGLSAAYTRHAALTPGTVAHMAAQDPVPRSDPRLLTDDRDRVGAWVAQRVGMLVPWGGFAALGHLDQAGRDLIGGVVFNNITATNANIHVALDGPLTRSFIHATFDYAFNQLDLHRLTGLVDADNAAALRFDTHLGFEYEHTIKEGNGGDVIMLVMWRDKCRWIRRNGEEHG